jgi:hypothetical protein
VINAALFFVPLAFVMARVIDLFAAHRRRTDPWGRA